MSEEIKTEQKPESSNDALFEKIQNVDKSYQNLTKQNQHLREKFDGDLAQVKSQLKNFEGLTDKFGSFEERFSTVQDTLGRLEAALPKPKERSYFDPSEDEIEVPNIFSDDSVLDREKANKELVSFLSKRDKHLQERMGQNQFDPNVIDEKFNAFQTNLQKMMEERDKNLRSEWEREAKDRDYRSQVQTRIDKLTTKTDGTKDSKMANLVQYAIVVNAQKPQEEQAIWPEDALKNLQKEQPELFAQAKAEKIVSDMVGNRRELPLDLGLAAASGDEPGDDFDEFFTKNVSHADNPLDILSAPLQK